MSFTLEELKETGVARAEQARSYIDDIAIQIPRCETEDEIRGINTLLRIAIEKLADLPTEDWLPFSEDMEEE